MDTQNSPCLKPELPFPRPIVRFRECIPTTLWQVGLMVDARLIGMVWLLDFFQPPNFFHKKIWVPRNHSELLVSGVNGSHILTRVGRLVWWIFLSCSHLGELEISTTRGPWSHCVQSHPMDVSKDREDVATIHQLRYYMVSDQSEYGTPVQVAIFFLAQECLHQRDATRNNRTTIIICRQNKNMDVRLLPQSSAHDNTCYKNFKLPKSLIHIHVIINKYIHINHANQIKYIYIYMTPFKPSREIFPVSCCIHVALYIPSKAVNGNLRFDKERFWCWLRIGV